MLSRQNSLDFGRVQHVRGKKLKTAGTPDRAVMLAVPVEEKRTSAGGHS